MSTMIPFEVILSEILPRTPAQSLLRFKCVCKSFNTLISSPKFVELHLKNTASNDSNRLLVLHDHKVYYNGTIRIIRCLDLSDNSFCLFIIHLRSPEYPDTTYRTVGSCNGLVLVKVCSIEPWFFKNISMLFNPCTGEILGIPDNDEEEVIKFFGFGYDLSSQDYKIVGIVDKEDSNVDGFSVLVYSLKANSWRLIDENPCLSQFSLLKHRENNGVLINDYLLHWLFYSYEMNRNIIGCFDLRSEKWVKDVPLPDYRGDMGNRLIFELFESQRDLKDDVKDLGVLDGCLCVLTENQKKCCVDVWVMKEYGIKESWVKILGFSDSIVTKYMKYCPLAYRGIEKNEILVLKEDDDDQIQRKSRAEILWYNIRDKSYDKITEAEVDGVDACICHGSLVVLPNSKKINDQS